MRLNRPSTTSHRRWRALGAPLALAVLLAVAATACGGSSAATGTKGRTASTTGAKGSLPNATLTPLAGGKDTTLAAFEGKPLVVNLWATWCAPCRREMPAFESVHQKLGDKVTIVGVTDDLNRDGSTSLARSLKVTYPLLFDSSGGLQTDLSVIGLPATIFVDAHGKVLERHQGELTASQLTEKIGALYGTR